MAFCVSLFAIYSNADNNENKETVYLTPGFPSQRQERKVRQNSVHTEPVGRWVRGHQGAETLLRTGGKSEAW